MNDPYARDWARKAVAVIGPRDEDAPALIEVIKRTPNPETHGSAVGFLALTKMTPESIAVLQSGLESTNVFIRRSVISAVSSLTNHADVFLPSLIKRLGDEDSVTEMAAVESIWKLSGRTNEILPVLKLTLEKEESSRRAGHLTMSSEDAASLFHALHISGCLAQHATPLVPLIKNFQSSRVARFPFAAARALSMITGETESILSSGKVVLADYDPDFRAEVAKTMAELCLQEKLVAPLEDGMLGHRDLAVRVYAARALWKLKGFDERIVPIMNDGLQDYVSDIHRELREISATTLGEMGRGAVMAIPALEVALDDGAPEVVAAARVALGKVRK